MSEPLSSSPNKPIIFWLFGICFLLWLMIMLGGATRLTHSGLSIVEWKPIVGTIPPLTESAWREEFSKYQQFPEYQLVNYGMSLLEFKFIYFMEYAHRLLGRLIGLFFVLPLCYFWLRGSLGKELQRSLLIVLVLGIGQGAMGWYMVKSGLVKDPSVSHYRLTTHLLLALLLLGILFWNALVQLYRSELTVLSPSSTERRFHTSTLIVIHLSALLIILTILYGGFVAGLKAGKIYNTYPLMEGQFLPSEWNFITPWVLNFIENAATVQWVHRILALMTLCVVLFAMGKLVRDRTASSASRQGAALLVALLLIQVVLGIATLLYEVPVSLGTLHQGMGVLVFTAILYVMFQVKRDRGKGENGGPGRTRTYDNSVMSGGF